MFLLEVEKQKRRLPYAKAGASSSAGVAKLWYGTFFNRALWLERSMLCLVSICSATSSDQPLKDQCYPVVLRATEWKRGSPLPSESARRRQVKLCPAHEESRITESKEKTMFMTLARNPPRTTAVVSCMAIYSVSGQFGVPDTSSKAVLELCVD